MAEKQLAYRVSGKDEFFADDDPLAELARIVGFDTRPAAPVAANQRQEPVFDLEDELLREFERYDTPRAAAPAAAVPPTPEYIAPLPAAIEDPAPEYADYAPTELEPVSAISDQDLWQPEQSHAPAAYEADAASLNPAEESWDLSSAASPEPIAKEAFVAPAVETSGLEDELELSIVSAPVASPIAKTPQWAAASIRLPLANFNAQHRDLLAPSVAAPVEPVLDIAPPAPVADFEIPSVLGFPTEQDRHEIPVPEAPVEVAPVEIDPIVPEFDLAAAARDGTIEPDAALTEPAYEPAAGLSAMDIDDLLADVSRYPVPAREAAARIEPTVSFAREPLQTQPAALPVDAFIMEPAAVHQPAVAEHVAEEIDPFDDHEFDLDLADIELELAELDLAEANTTPHHQDASPVADTSSDDDWLYETPETAAVYEAPAAPVITAPYAVEPAAVETESFVEEEQELPFDPSEISDTEDRIETFEDMHVPALPPVEQEEPIAAAPDYDFDIDAEMANLFSPAPPEPAAEPAGAAPIGEAVFAQAAAASVRNAAFPRPAEGLDEFERALEEDFRRSFRESSGPTENVSQMMFESSSVTNDRWRARSMRGFAIAAAAVVVVGAGAYGVYGWMAHGGSSLGFTSGEPRVIVADKDPVKVLPEDPGGKIVPNQDKAVYDRVAGDAAQAPKQKELVTSNEQPVDVVQKTLIPEAVSPDDSEGDPNAGAPTPVGETEDPRLLPNQGNTAAAAPQDGVPSVSPRKVRTMIVKPDGTLVAREEDAPAVGDAPKPATAAPALATPTKPPANGKPTANTQVASATPAAASNTDGNAASAESAPIRVVKTTSIANAPVAAAPVTVPSDAATAVPTARPTPPAAVVTSPTPVKPVVAAKPPVAPKPTPTQVAAATPAPQPIKATAAAATTTPAAASAGGYVMQIASLPSEEEAKRSQANLSAKFGSVIGGHPIEVRKVDIAGKGTYYRVRVAVGSKDDAADLCVKLRAAGGTCLISK